jgi:hypothetical protein
MAVCVTLPLAALPARAAPSGPTATDKRCATLGQIVPAAEGVAGGNASSTGHQAHVLDNLANRKHVPHKVQAALEKVAQWFRDARDRSLNERLVTLRLLRPQIVAIVTYTRKKCGTSTTSTTRVP